MLSNTMEGARLAFCEANGSCHVALFPRSFIEQVISKEANTPEIDLWVRDNAVQVSAAIIDCNFFKKPEPPFDMIWAGGTFATAAIAAEE